MKKLLIGVAAAASIFALAAPAGASQYVHPKIHKWYAKEGGKQAVNRLSADLTSIGNDATNNDMDAVGTDCQNLRNDAQVGIAITPIPSKSINRLWVAALNDYEQAGTTCVNGVNDDSASEIDRATSDITAGTALINHLSAEL